MVNRDEDGSSRSSTVGRKRDSRRDSDDSSRRLSEERCMDTKKLRLDESAVPRLRLNASLATDPALRPAAVAALTIRPENVSPPNSAPPLPAGLQNGKICFFLLIKILLIC